MALSPGEAQRQTVTQANFTAYSDALQAVALDTTRLAATSLPSDLSFHRSIDSVLARDVDAFSARVIGLTGRLIMLANGPGTGNTRLEEEDIVDGFVRTVVDSMEGMLEKADDALDEYLGRKKAPSISVPAGPINLPQHRGGNQREHHSRGRLDPALTHASHLPKPQLKFRHRYSNTDESPYIPAALISHKWCAKVPLGYVLQHERPEDEDSGDVDEEDENERKKRTMHPYYYELTNLTYPDHVFNPPKASVKPTPLDISSPPLKSRAFTLVTTPKSLLSFANKLSTATEIAIDLEHHSYRSYRGFLALMQVSTREEDFVVDLLVPEVREAFRQGKEKGKRVFHGAESDIIWLQQDFNIFVVGLFDTFHASKVLEFSKHGLANLLETYCDFVPDKRYQLADWRIRPLPAEMLTYARSDTHFLLYIYDRLRLALIDRAVPPSSEYSEDSSLPAPSGTNPAHALIHTVLSRSSRTALRLYEVEVYDAIEGYGSGGWDTLAKKWNKTGLVNGQRLPSSQPASDSSSIQGAVYRAVHKWREEVAREEDESTRYVLPTHHLFLLAERPPTTVPDLLSLLGGGVTRGIPPVLKRRAGELVAVVKDAIPSVSHKSGNEDVIGVDEGERVLGEDADMTFNASSAVNSGPKSPWAGHSGLWSFSANLPTFVMPHSSLFGAGDSQLASSGTGSQRGISHTTEVRSYIARRSALFGNAVPEIVASTTASSMSILSTPMSRLTQTQTSNATSERFKNLVTRIHRTLVVAPVVPTVSETKIQDISGLDVTTAEGVQDTSLTVPVASNLTSSTPATQVEIPFVPVHQRQSTSNALLYTPLEDDTIVVVGQAGARQRKRKRDKNRGLVSKSAVEASAGNNDGDVTEFDYSKVPNLLDGDAAEGNPGVAGEESERRKRRKQGKGLTGDPLGFGLFDSGNFRAPLQDGREVKSGRRA
ncbi:hypothetical protein F5I97DRAFT_1937438 [Phlebopus sp. FC_14]|nr:hypothetical protein F5I97DRAFT_1937438 [Phlebopus sp. FC_14]